MQVDHGVTKKLAMNKALKEIDRIRFIAKLVVLDETGPLHSNASLLCLPALSHVTRIIANGGIPEIVLDRSMSILFKCPIHQPNYKFFTDLDRRAGCAPSLEGSSVGVLGRLHTDRDHL
jgi:hypothetical protein